MNLFSIRRYFGLLSAALMFSAAFTVCKGEKPQTKVVYLPKGALEAFQKENKEFIKYTVGKLQAIHKSVSKKKPKPISNKKSKVKSKLTIAADLKAAKNGKPNAAVAFASDLAKALGKKDKAKKKGKGKGKGKPAKPFYDDLGAGGPIAFAQALGALKDKKQEDRFSKINSSDFTLKNLKKVKYLLVVDELEFSEPAVGSDAEPGAYQGNVYVFDISKKKPKSVGQFSFEFDGKKTPGDIDEGTLSEIKKEAEKELRKFGAGINSSLFKKMAKIQKIQVLKSKGNSKGKKKKKKD